MSDVSEAPEPDADIASTDATHKFLTIEKRQKHTMLQLRAEFRADMDVRIGPLEQSYTELVAGQNLLRDRVDAIENSLGGEISQDFKRFVSEQHKPLTHPTPGLSSRVSKRKIRRKTE